MEDSHQLKFKQVADGGDYITVDQLKTYLESIKPPLKLNFEAIKSLWFTPAHGGRGRSLLELKDVVLVLHDLLWSLFKTYANDAIKGMVVSEFRKFLTESKSELDESAVDSNFYECTGYPEDEDNVEEVNSLRADVGKFATAVVRIANATDLQESGQSDKSLKDQLVDWLTNSSGALKFDPDTIVNALGSLSLVRDASYFDPPAQLIGSKPRVFVEFAIQGTGIGIEPNLASNSEDELGRVEIELDAITMPRTAYNFLCLCTGQRGIGEITGLPLCYRNCTIHRIVADLCIQGGDFELGDGYGGESIYGGEFDDEGFTIKHDRAGIVSMGNTGNPNSNTSQFFITLAAAPHLDNDNCAFGSVVSGMDVVKRIAAIAVDEDEKPIKPCYIKDCGIVSS